MKKAQAGLVLCALLWGASGVLTQVALMDMSPMMLIFFRFLISSGLGIFIFWKSMKRMAYETMRHSLILSALLMVIYGSSTYGLMYTSASNAGFIIGSSVVLVPVINRLFFKTYLRKSEVLSSILCLVGLALVTLKGATKLNVGDLLCFVDAIAYSLYIIYNSRLKDVQAEALITSQYSMVAVMTGIYVVFEGARLSLTTSGILATLVLGLLCTFVTFYIQLKSQKYLKAEEASRILALIPVFTVFFDVLYFQQMMTLPALFGGVIVVLSTMQKPKSELET